MDLKLLLLGGLLSGIFIGVFYLIFLLRDVSSGIDEKIRKGIADGKAEISEYVEEIHKKSKLLGDELQQYQKSIEAERLQKFELTKQVHKYENMIRKYKKKILTLKGEKNA